MLNPFGAGRNTGILALGVVFFAIQLVLFTAVIGNGGLSLFGRTGEIDALNRPVLSSHMPVSMPGWHKRSYLTSDGEAITQGARGGGLEARLAIGEDMEQFRLYEKAGINTASAVYVNGDQRIAVAIMRGIMKMPPWLEQNGLSAASWADKVAGVHDGRIGAIVQGLAFERRAVKGPEGAGGYDRYVARIGHELTIDVIANAGRDDVETLLARIDGVALKAQLPEDSAAIDAAFGVVLHHMPETWPARTEPAQHKQAVEQEAPDTIGRQKLRAWIDGLK